MPSPTNERSRQANEWSEADRQWRAAAHIIKTMLDSGKPVASICAGQVVLAAHGALNDRRAAIPPLVAGEAKFQWMFNDASIKWQKFPVVTDATGPKGKVVITAAGPPQAEPFAKAILKAIEK